MPPVMRPQNDNYKCKMLSSAVKRSIRSFRRLSVRACRLNTLAFRIIDSSSINAVNFSSHRTTKRFPSPRCRELFYEAGENSLDQVRNFYRQHLGSDPAAIDSIDAADALIRWAKLRRGFPYSQYRAQLWEFVVEIADAALWLGWLYPDNGPGRKTFSN
jgi:hypothetical protein